MNDASKRIYDGALFCASCSCGCPVVEHDPVSGVVTVFDPAKPENGLYRMSKDEYNALIQNAKPIA